MNAKRSLCTISSIVLLLLGAGETKAQTFYERTLQQNLWNYGMGVNGIREGGLSIAEAGINAGYESGEFRSASDAQSMWSVNATTQALRHFDKFSLIGAFGFTQKQGDGMCGPMSINPGYYPIEVWEFTPGRKTLQSYLVDGGISVDLSDELRLGGRFTMNSQNYSKRKDIRHTNYRLDMECKAGMLWHSGDIVLELDGILGKNAETITAEQVGTAVSTYYAFLDKGQMYGEYELWNGSGIHLNESGVSGLPLKEMIYGAAIEAGLGQKIFASLQYRHSEGSAGEKEYIWYRFPGDRLDARLAARFGAHTAMLGFHARRQTNNETVLDKVTSGGITNVSSYGSNKIFERRDFGVTPSYEFRDDTYDFKVSVDYEHESSAASQMYPYVTGQELGTLDATLSQMLIWKHVDVELKVGYGRGWLSESQRKVEEVETGTQPERYQDGYGLMTEYRTVPRVHSGVDARWYPKKRTWFIGASLHSTHAIEDVSFLGGRSRVEGKLSFGIEF